MLVKVFDLKKSDIFNHYNYENERIICTIVNLLEVIE